MKFQFSLFDSLLLLTLCAGIVGIVLAKRELMIGEPRNRELRQRAGELTIDNAANMIGIRLPAYGLNPTSSDWNVHIPSNAEYRICFARIDMQTNPQKAVTGFVPAEDVTSIPISKGLHQIYLHWGELAEDVNLDNDAEANTKDLKILVDGKQSMFIKRKIRRDAMARGGNPFGVQNSWPSTGKMTIGSFSVDQAFDSTSSFHWKVWIEATTNDQGK